MSDTRSPSPLDRGRAHSGNGNRSPSLDLAKGDRQSHKGKVSDTLAQYRRAYTAGDSYAGQALGRNLGQEGRDTHRHAIELEGEGHNGEEAAERKAEDLPARIKAQEQYINVKEVERCKNEEYMIKLFKYGTESVKKRKMQEILNDLDKIEKT